MGLPEAPWSPLGHLEVPEAHEMPGDLVKGYERRAPQDPLQTVEMLSVIRSSLEDILEVLKRLSGI